MNRHVAPIAAALASIGALATTSNEASAQTYWPHGYAPYAYGPYSAGYDYYWSDAIDDAAEYFTAAEPPPYDRGLRIVAAPGKRLKKFRWARPYQD